MKHTERRRQGKGAFDLIEEATHLLRTAPSATLATYYLGTIPFVLGLLFFWADMSRSPFAPQHLADAAFGLAVLFIWMKFCHALFGNKLRAQAAGVTLPPMELNRAWKIFMTQAIIQPSGLLIIPLSLVPALPFPWVFAFYQNATALAGRNESDVTRLAKKSWRQAKLWPGQNNIVLALLTCFAGCILLNWVSVCFILPQLAKMLFGVASVYTRSPFSLLNTTFFAGMCGVTYLCMDPLIKAVYALRCFYGESLESGEDLKAELKPFSRPLAATGALVIVMGFLFASSSLAAETKTPPATPPQISTTELDRAINQTIHERKYTWRMPRESTVDAESDKGVIARFIQKVTHMLRGWVKATLDWLDRVFRKIFNRDLSGSSASDASGYGWIMFLEILLYGLLIVVALVLAVFLYRVWKRRERRHQPMASEPFQVTPDIEDENVRADQLPEEGWVKLARELLERGEFRLAMRAFYLASLSHLAARNLIHIARFKSNREYELELRRRGHSFPNLLLIFADNVSAFEQIWYGTHEVNHESVNRFAANVDKLKSTG